MGEVLRKKLKVDHFESEIQEALLNVLVAANYIREQLDQACSKYRITAAQYNVLRILNGGPNDGYARREILERMIERAPDCTRLIDRLEKRGFVQRNRTKSDRRLSLTRITDEGRQLLDRMRHDMDHIHNRVMGRLSQEARQRLSRLLEDLYAEKNTAQNGDFEEDAARRPGYHGAKRS